jgi:hypothetical protein
MRIARTFIATVVVGFAASAAVVGRAAAPPVGPIPSGPTTTSTTQRGELVAFALPRRPNGRSWRLVRNSAPNVLTQISEGDVGTQVVVVFKATASGRATVVFALTRGEHPKVYESRRLAVHVR